MASLEDLERRVIELEERLHMEAGLAASRDRDVSDMKQQLNTHGRLLQALVETQQDQGRSLARIENAVSGLTTEMGSLRLEMRTGFQMIANLIDPENESGPDT